MIFKETSLRGNYLISFDKQNDERGFFSRIFSKKDLKLLVKKKTINQINHSFTKKQGTIRGLHFQHPPYAEIKIIFCIKGKVWDVAVDLRKNSPTFLQYYSLILSEDIPQAVFIPEGFAHGFQTLTSNCEMLYLHTEYYSSKYESALNALDPRLQIKWPQLITERSERDKNHPMLDEDYYGIDLS
jgi:dTDP-4-dehydrorhamnose 3,5-epimerase